VKTPAAHSVGVFFFMDIWNILINLNMKYLVVDGGLSGTGIRDKYDGGYIYPADLGLSPEITAHIGAWVSKYENEHFTGFKNKNNLIALDAEGRGIAVKIKKKISGC